MTALPYDLTGPIGSAGTLGLIVLQVDETIEQDFRRLFPMADVALHVSRLPSGAALTPDTIAEMAQTLPAAAGLLPGAAAFDVVGYGCTSGTTLIGVERVANLIRGAAQTAAVTEPLSAARAAFAALGVRSVGLVTPYIASVAEPIRAAFEAGGVAVPRAVSFGEEIEARVARIAPHSIREAALQVAGGVDGVFLSCTNLRTLDVIAGLETALGKPVLSSNLVLAWHMARLAGLRLNGPGRLLRG